MNKLIIVLLCVALSQATTGLRSEILEGKYRSEYKKLHTVKNSFSKPRPHEYTSLESLPDSFDWGNVNGTSFLTRNLN